MASAECASVEAPQTRRGGGVWAGGVPLPNRAGVLGGAVPPAQKFFNFLPRNGAFFEHSDTIMQRTRPVSIKPAKSADVRANASACCIPLKRLLLAVFCHS